MRLDTKRLHEEGLHRRAQRTYVRDRYDFAHYTIAQCGGLRRYILVEMRRAPEAFLMRVLLDRPRGRKLLEYAKIIE